MALIVIIKILRTCVHLVFFLIADLLCYIPYIYILNISNVLVFFGSHHHTHYVLVNNKACRRTYFPGRINVAFEFSKRDVARDSDIESLSGSTFSVTCAHIFTVSHSSCIEVSLSWF